MRLRSRVRRDALAAAVLGGLAGCSLCGTYASAATIAHWDFDDAAAGTQATTLASSPAGLTGTATTNPNPPGASGAIRPTFDASVPGSPINDGLGGPAPSAANETSLRFTNTVPGNGSTSQNGSKVTVPGSSAAVKPASFTMEAFVRVSTGVDFATIVGKTRADRGGSTFLMDVASGGQFRVRIDSQADGALNDPVSGANPPGFNQSFTSSKNIEDGLWHHVALTYDGSNRAVRLYADYAQVGSGTATNALVYDNSDLVIGQGGGGRALDGWVDEVRFSDAVLPTSAFLRAVPEPSSLGALAGGSGLLFRRRRRRSS